MNVIWLNYPLDPEPLEYRAFPGPWGEMLAVWHGEALCRLAFVDSDDDRQVILRSCERYWGTDVSGMAPGDERYQRLDEAIRCWPEKPSVALVVEALGTPFQHRVWRLLLQSRPGQTVSYASLAERLGKRGGARAVGQAVAANPLALLVPCHRVVPSSGGVGGYQWGKSRKQDLLSDEAVVNAPDAGSGAAG